MTFLTEFEFVLPKGYVDKEGNVHKEGLMRLAKALDEIQVEKDMRVQSNPSFSTLIILSRVILKLGKLTAENGQINPDIIGSLFMTDFKFLISFYEKINQDGNLKIDTMCPKCETKFKVDFGTLQ